MLKVPVIGLADVRMRKETDCCAGHPNVSSAVTTTSHPWPGVKVCATESRPMPLWVSSKPQCQVNVVVASLWV